MKKITFLKNKKVLKIILIIFICLIAATAIIISIIAKAGSKETSKETSKVTETTILKKEKKTTKVVEATKPVETTTTKETTSIQPETTIQVETTTIPLETKAVSPETTTNTITNTTTDAALLAEAKKYVNDYRAYLNEVLEYTNQVRAEVGIAPLILDDKLSEAAMARALENSKKNKISHERPDGSEWYSILSSSAITYGAAAENIAAGQNSATSVVAAWKGSSGHYANMITDSYKKLGVGLVIDPNNSFGYTWVQLFTD